MEDANAFRTAVRARAAAMSHGDASPCDPALEIFGLACRGWPGEDGDEACCSLALLRGALTDWAELRPAETDRAETHMIAAVHEWPAVEGDREAEARYFDRWVHDIPGYECPASPRT